MPKERVESKNADKIRKKKSKKQDIDILDETEQIRTINASDESVDPGVVSSSQTNNASEDRVVLSVEINELRHDYNIRPTMILPSNLNFPYYHGHAMNHSQPLNQALPPLSFSMVHNLQQCSLYRTRPNCFYQKIPFPSNLPQNLGFF